MYIVKNIVNEVPVTLAEKQTSTTHDWLFEFTNESTGVVKYCHAVDVSLYPSRCNLFMITDSATENPYNATLNFTPTGSWSFKVYEMPVASPPSLTPTGYLAICEAGSLKVYDPTENPKVNFNGDNTKNNAVFNG